jgi:hypothetical protein
MDIKQRLAQAIEKQRVVAYEPVDVDIVELCQYALAEIERLEKGNKSDKITRLETLVCMLARAILQHEYSKDLCRHGTEEACKAMANEGDLEKAVSILASNR